MQPKEPSRDLDLSGRRRRARTWMADHGLDAILVTGGPNLAYFTGASGMLGSNSGSRPLLFVLPREGAPVLVVQRLLAKKVADDVPDVECRPYDRLSSLRARELRSVLADLGLTESRIGVEYGPETTLSIPVGEFLAFAETLEDAEFVDAQPLFVDLRRRKTPAEIARIERACEVTAEAYERTLSDVEAGMTGAEIESLVRRHLLDCGGASPWALVTTGSDSYERTASGGGDAPTSNGDMVWVDGGCAVDGYMADFSRAGVIGGPSDRQRAAQRAVYELTCDAVAAIEPGASIASVARGANAAVDALELPVTADLSRQAGRIGHSLGLQVTELPSLCPDADGTFHPRMVVTVEPAFATEYGTFHVEANVAVTQDGTRTLSPDWWRLRTI